MVAKERAIRSIVAKINAKARRARADGISVRRRPEIHPEPTSAPHALIIVNGEGVRIDNPQHRTRAEFSGFQRLGREYLTTRSPQLTQTTIRTHPSTIIHVRRIASDLNISQSMAASEELAGDIVAGKATLGAGHLITPQEQTYDSFSKDESEQKSEHVHTVSLPISPEQETALRTFTPTSSHQVQDELLFPDNSHSESSQAPLFESQGEQSEEDTTTTPASTSTVRLPQIVYVRGTLIPIKDTKEAAYNYWKDVMGSNDRTRALQRSAGMIPLPAPRKSSVPPLDQESEDMLRSLTRPAGITKRRSPPRAVITPRLVEAHMSRAATPELTTEPATTPATPPAPTPARRSRTPKPRTQSEFYTDAFPGDDDKKHKRAAPSKQTASKEEDLLWHKMDDFCPPTSVLSSSNRLKAMWGTGGLPIENETDYNELHPMEVELVATLRLKPVQYLANKRRIFAGKVNALKENKDFRKTNAQNVCNIDVNKTSRIFEAFKEVGWLDRKWFEQYL
ncbi:hypothetical protein LTR27_011406 [Elasticomyces elasticus]|nr:hypothetical protein LTR27_011406 [Elasticomyces elasticus]